MSKKTFLTQTEALSFASFTHSDLRRLIKRKEAIRKKQEGIDDLMPVVIAMREITKQDLKIWRQLYEEGVRDFNRLPDDPNQLQLNFHKIDIIQQKDRWAAGFHCQRCGTKGQENFTYIESIVTGEVHKCHKCEEKSVFPHEPKTRKR